MLFEAPAYGETRVNYLTAEDLLCTSSEDEELVEESEMAKLGIPSFLERSYRNGTPPPVITALRDWQVELFSLPEWRRGESCLVLAPTAGGKTTAADVAIAQMLEHDPKGKALYCLPFVSLANEKFFDYTKRFPSFSVRPFYGNIGQADFQHGSIAICTYEKAHSLINMAMMNNTIDKIRLVVIDEIHMLGDSGRGAGIEALVAKLRLLINPPRIVGLSATISSEDSQLFAKFLGGFVFKSATRPSPITQLMMANDGFLYTLSEGQLSNRTPPLDTVPGDRYHILPIIASTIQKNPSCSILIFARTKRETEHMAKFIAAQLFVDLFRLPNPTFEILEKRERLLEQLPDKGMSNCIRAGVSYHHAGLLLEERKVIENGLRDGTLTTVVATSTLSAGINIPSVSLVILLSIHRFDQTKLSGAEYNQMAGRAGRAGAGTVVVCQSQYYQKGTDEIELIKEYSKQKVGNIRGHLLEGDFERFFLQCCVFFQGHQEDLTSQAFEFAKGQVNAEFLQTRMKDAQGHLIDLKLLAPNSRPTQLGEAIAHANFGIDEGIIAYQRLVRAQKLLCLSDEMHLLFLCVPNEITFSIPDFAKVGIWDKLYDQHNALITEVLKISDYDYKSFTVKPENPQIAADLNRLYGAAVLLAVINEEEISKIEKEFEITRGEIQALQNAASTFSGQLVKLASKCRMNIIAAAIREFKRRLLFGVKDELLGLLQIPFCTRVIARLLYDQGLCTIRDVAESNIVELIVTTGEKEQIVQQILNKALELVKIEETQMKMEEESEQSRLLPI